MLAPGIWDEISLQEYLVYRIYCLEMISLVLEKVSVAKEAAILRAMTANSGTEGTTSGTPSSQLFYLWTIEIRPYGVVQQVQVIRDVNDISLSTFTGLNKEAFEKISKLSSDNYPEILLKCYIINAPWLFGAIWALAQLFLAPGTVAKVSMMGTDFLNHITQSISIESIPTFLGTFIFTLSIQSIRFHKYSSFF